MLFSNRNEFLRDSSRIEPIPPNIRNDIVSESAMTRSSSQLEKKNNETSRIPRIRKKSIRGDSGDSWPVWNRGIKLYRGYLLFWGEYQIYFIECGEKNQYFSRVRSTSENADIFTAQDEINLAFAEKM